jgi:hypothetical protein
MNPEDLFTELKDPTQWNATPRPVVGAFPARRLNPLVVSFATVTAVAVVIAILFGVFSSSIRAINPPVQPAVTPTPTVSIGAAYEDDGRVGSTEYASLAGSYSYELGEVIDTEGLVSVPWVAQYPYPEIQDLYITVVGGAPDGGDGATPAPSNDGDACWGRPVGAHVVETADSITITVYSTPPTKTADCATEAEVAGAHVMFQFPMKQRTLIHGGLSAPWDVTPVPILTKKNSNLDEPSDEPTTAPVLQDELYVTSEGLGDLRINEPIGSSSIATWEPDRCSGTWVMNDPFNSESLGHMVADIVMIDNAKNSPINHIMITSPEIPTKSGARVGDTLTSLKERFPNLGEPVTTDNYATYAIEGTTGKVLFDVGERDSLGMGEEPNPEVLVIRVVPIDADPVLPIGDTYGSCTG